MHLHIDRLIVLRLTIHGDSWLEATSLKTKHRPWPANKGKSKPSCNRDDETNASFNSSWRTFESCHTWMLLKINGSTATDRLSLSSTCHMRLWLISFDFCYFWFDLCVKVFKSKGNPVTDGTHHTTSQNESPWSNCYLARCLTNCDTSRCMGWWSCWWWCHNFIDLHNCISICNLQVVVQQMTWHITVEHLEEDSVEVIMWQSSGIVMVTGSGCACFSSPWVIASKICDIIKIHRRSSIQWIMTSIKSI